MNHIPLAEKLRPSSLDEYIGQKHLVGKNAILHKAIESGNIPSMIFGIRREWAKPRWLTSSHSN